MANFWYNDPLRQLANAELDLDTDTLIANLVMSNTTFDTERDVNDFVGVTLQDLYDGATYSPQTLTGLALVEQADPTNRLDVTANDAVFATIGAGARDAVGSVVYKETAAADASRFPIAFFDTGGFPFTGTGSTVTIQWNALGMLQLQA